MAENNDDLYRIMMSKCTRETCKAVNQDKNDGLSMISGTDF